MYKTLDGLITVEGSVLAGFAAVVTYDRNNLATVIILQSRGEIELPSVEAMSVCLLSDALRSSRLHKKPKKFDCCKPAIISVFHYERL